MMYMASPLGVVSATAAGATDPDHTTVDYMHEYLFGPFEVDTENPNKTVVNDTVYYDLQDSSIILRDLFTVAGDPDKLVPMANMEIEAATAELRAAGESRAATKASVKQRYKANVMRTWEENFVRTAEQLGVRLTGIFSYQVAAAGNDTSWNPDDNWRVREYQGTGSEYWDSASVHAINSMIDGGSFTLCDGTEIDIDLMNIQFVDGETAFHSDAHVQFLPFLFPASGQIDGWKWGNTDQGPALEWQHPDDGWVTVALDSHDESSQWPGAGTHPFSDIGWDTRLGESPLTRFYNLLDTLDTEVERYVDLFFDNVDPAEADDPQYAGPSTYAYKTGQDWAVTQETGLVQYAALLFGQSGGNAPAVIDVYKATDAANITDSTTPDATYDPAFLAINGDGESVTIDDPATDTEDSITVQGLKVGTAYNADATAVESATIYYEDDNGEAAGTRLDAADAFVIRSYTTRAGASLGAMPLEQYTSESTLDNADVKDLYERWSEAAEDYDQREGSAASDTGGGGGAVTAGSLPDWAMYVGGGAIAALLAALGISGAGSGGGR